MSVINLFVQVNKEKKKKEKQVIIAGYMGISKYWNSKPKLVLLILSIGCGKDIVRYYVHSHSLFTGKQKERNNETIILVVSIFRFPFSTLYTAKYIERFSCF